MQTWIDLKFGDGEYTFKLGLAQIVEIERKCGRGIGAIYAGIVRGRINGDENGTLPHEADFKLGDLVEVIRQGLIGGNAGRIDGLDVKVPTHRANELIEAYVLGTTDTRQALKSTWALAFSILYALIEGYSPPGEAEPAVAPATPTSGSTSSPPTSTGRQSGTRRKKSTA